MRTAARRGSGDVDFPLLALRPPGNCLPVYSARSAITGYRNVPQAIRSRRTFDEEKQT